MKITQKKAKEIAKDKMLNDTKIKNILKEYSDDTISFPSQVNREDITMYRTWITVLVDSGIEQNGFEEQIIAFCDVSFDSGESGNINFVFEHNRKMSISIQKASELAQSKLMQNSRIKKVLEKYSNRYSTGSQMLSGNCLVYRTYFYLNTFINNEKSMNSANLCSAYCDVFLETGECSEIVFLDLFKELE